MTKPTSKKLASLIQKAEPDATNNAHQLAVAKLATSGLTEDDMRLLRMEALEPEETIRKHTSFLPYPSLYIPYFDPRNLEAPLRPRPHWPAFYRLRYLHSDPNQIRYTNEPEAGVAAYFPPTTDWPSVIHDVKYTILITEGELKAACASKCGYPTIGLGGVWNFRSAKLGETFLPELENIQWVKRRVYILFDSDVMRNEQVQGALQKLAEELAARGALPFFVDIPEALDGKQGLDDWVVSNPSASLADLCKLHQPLATTNKLFDLNHRFYFVLRRGFVIEKTSYAKFPIDRFRDSIGNINYSEFQLNNGTVVLKKTNIANAWLKWPCRSQVEDLCYAPGKPKDHNGNFNLWHGWACEPKRGSVQPFLKLLKHLFTGAEPGALMWFLRWLAYPLQNPGVKLYTAALLHGKKQGTGKSLIGYTMGKIYGENHRVIGNQELHGAFNSWAEGTQFVHVDEVSGTDKRAENDLFKRMITQIRLRINSKYMPEYEVEDCVNYYLNSNHTDPIYIEPWDRRFFVHEVVVAPLSDKFFDDYLTWLANGGAEAVFSFLLRLPMKNFSPTSAAMRTAAKDRLIADVQSDVGEWVQQLATTPDAMLLIGETNLKGDLFSARELLSLFDPGGTKRLTAPGMARELRRQGIPVVCEGRYISYSRQSKAERYFVLRHATKWANAEVGEVIEELRRIKA